MRVPLADIRTLRALYQAQVLIPADAAVLRHKSSGDLLDKVSLYQGDITKLEVDAIVNAANRSLLGGGGVDGAIHAAAGRGLLEECYSLNGCDTGDAKMTKGYNLPARHVIHAVGPIYSEPRAKQKSEQLASCYSRSLDIAAQHSLKSIAFPSISTGIYGYPIKDATHVAINEVRHFLDARSNDLDRVIFVVWSDDDKEVYRDLLPLYFPLDDALQSDTKKEEQSNL
ncbi:hypothetical protein NM688_g9010 [Phlebia brevispora]|uniref:Uncharacterized protein n=1 Tax=Phlebia brevispora TaxID=194682 RepID=A0ACC1RLU7_9APHY|nr:hypothetical protein NM688_g9010 [Phlebia brevispora]